MTFETFAAAQALLRDLTRRRKTPRTPAPPSATPAPGRHGGITYTVRAWNCGRIRVWDSHGTVICAIGCDCLHIDLSDAAIERFISDARG